MKSIRKDITVIFAIMVMMVLGACSSGTGNETADVSTANLADNNLKAPTNGNEASTSESNSGEALDTVMPAQKSTPENDTEMGINNIKFDTNSADRTEAQKLAAEYFNGDYMFVNMIKGLQRYPKIFDNALIQSYVYVYKVISYNGDDYELLATMIQNSEEMGYGGMDDSYLDDSRFVVLRGSTDEYRYIVDDMLLVEGRYTGVETITVDGVSLTVPTIDVYKGYLYSDSESWFSLRPRRFTLKEIKNLAKGIFGDDISARKDSVDDYPGMESEYYCDEIYPSYVVEFDNPQNRRIEKLLFDTINGKVYSANDYSCYFKFSEDGAHFIMYYYSTDSEMITVEYYSNSLERLWKREFKVVDEWEVYSLSRNCDLTANCMYLYCGGEVYTVNLQTGEDVRQSLYVGENKATVRKFSNGLLLVGTGKTNAFMYVDLSGQIAWKTDATDEIDGIDTVQMIDNRIVIKTSGYDENWNSCDFYYVIDAEDGTLIFNGEIESDYFYHFG